ncbi:MAG: class I SAM-dependent methyltransferase [Candidatus Hodarchaeota archaeon]
MGVRLSNIFDKLVLKVVSATGKVFLLGWCSICARPTAFTICGENLREDVLCIHCLSFNRSRQMYYTFRKELKEHPGGPHTITIWNTESSRSLHDKLKKFFKERYMSSEYFGTDVKSGDVVNGVLHEDICNTSFPSNHFDFILSSDVLEHVPEPQRALSEIQRVLKPGGKFIFTVPFVEGMPQSEIRARLREDGTIEHIQEPMYHGDPLRREGILVYVIFGEDLLNMCKKAGLILKKQKLYSLLNGIIGTNAIIFIAQKTQEQYV